MLDVITQYNIMACLVNCLLMAIIDSTEIRRLLFYK